MNQIKLQTTTSVAFSAQVENYVNQYRMCVKKTADAILQLANVVAEAKRELSKDNFAAFRKAISADASKDSFIKKLLVIAKASARLNSFSKNLPPSYTTLYSLSKMTDEQFAKISSDDVISPQMTALTLSKYIEKKQSAVKFEVFLSFENLSDADTAIALARIKAICAEFKITLKSKIDDPQSQQISKLSDLKAAEIVDVMPKEELVAA